MNIWCLFSVTHEYDQPSNNLVAWWEEKPSIEKLAETLGMDMKLSKDQDLANLCLLWVNGLQHNPGDTDYRLEYIGPGKLQD
jgi:hypothetical protein